MDKLLTKWLEQKGVKSPEDLDNTPMPDGSPTERETFENYRAGLDMKEVTVTNIKNFCKGHVGYIEAKWADYDLDAKKKNNGGGDNLKMLLLTPGEKERIEAIEQKTSKLGMETTFRVLYIDKRDSFSRDNIMAVFGAVRQFHMQNLNSLRPNKDVTTHMKKGLFRNRRLNWRRRYMYERYKYIVPTKPSIAIWKLPAIIVSPPQNTRPLQKRSWIKRMVIVYNIGVIVSIRPASINFVLFCLAGFSLKGYPIRRVCHHSINLRQGFHNLKAIS